MAQTYVSRFEDAEAAAGTTTLSINSRLAPFFDLHDADVRSSCAVVRRRCERERGGGRY